MPDRLVLLDWDPAGAAALARRLAGAGHVVECHTDPADPAIRVLPRHPPDAIVIDLARRPSLGRDLALWLRSRASTRHVPIVFVEGDPQATTRVRGQLPDATYTSRRAIRGAVRRALASPPVDPVAPGPMSGYSGTPLPRKLGIKSDTVLALLGAPADFERTLGPLPATVRIRRQARGASSVVMLFVRTQVDLARRFDGAVRIMQEGGRLWIVWPKRASGEATDLGQAVVRAHGLDRGLVDYKIAAIDATWSGLCFARRGSYSKRSRK